jgi:hypothetical protein
MSKFIQLDTGDIINIEAIDFVSKIERLMDRNCYFYSKFIVILSNGRKIEFKDRDENKCVQNRNCILQYLGAE